MELDEIIDAIGVEPFHREEAGVVYHADCLSILPKIPAGAIDLVLTDPPYDEKTHSGARYGFRETSSIIPFSPLSDFGFLAELLRVSQSWILCFCALEMFGDYKRASGQSWVRAGFWRRSDGVPQFTGDRPGQPGEGIAIMHGPTVKRWNGNGKHGYWVCGIERTDRCHPTQKPLILMRELLSDFSNDNDLILDPFLGSGTTAVAAKQLGRKFIGIEIEEKYCRIAVDRLRQGVLEL